MKERVTEIVNDKYIDLQTKLQMDNLLIDRNIDKKLLTNSHRQESHKQKKKTILDKRNALYSRQVSDRMIVGQKDS